MALIRFELCSAAGWYIYEREVPEEVLRAAEARQDRISFLRTRLQDPRIVGHVMIMLPGSAPRN